jgi:raffinose/stachyose/melibiose transport system permease protein
MAGFALSKFKIRGAAGLWVFFSFGIFLVLQPLLVPLRQGVLSAGLYDSGPGVLIPYLGLGIPLGVWLGTEFVGSIPDGIIESALLDGAGYFRIFRSIILPMALPGGALIAALVFTLTWNEYLLISVLVSPGSPAASLTLGLAAPGAGEAGAAALVIGLAPGLVIFLFLRKYFFRAAGMIRG